MNLTEELRQLLKGNVFDNDSTLKKYSNDASIFEMKPRLVVIPKDKEDIKTLISFVNNHPKEKLSITCRSGGTDMSGGAITDSILVDVSKHMNRILEIREEPGPNNTDGYAIVEPGVFYRDFAPKAKAKNLLFPSYPASKDICTWGGIVNNNSGGEKSLIYGKTERYVEEVTLILRDGKEYTFGPVTGQQLKAKMRQNDLEGEIYQKLYDIITKNWDAIQKAKPDVSKNSAGYYLWNVWDKKTFNVAKLIVGSQGTFGVMTQAKVRLVRPHKYSALLVVFLRELEPLNTLVPKVLQHKPESLESYDDHTLRLALKFFFSFIKLLGGNVFTLAFEFLPEVRMLITGGLPKLVLLAEFTADSKEEALAKAAKAKEDLREFDVSMRVAKSKGDIEKYFTIRRQSFNLLRKHIKKKKSSPFIDDIVVKPEVLPEFLPKLNKILERYPSLIYTIAGHVGDGNFHIIPLMDLSKQDQRSIIAPLSKKVYDLTLQYKGSITAEHNDGLIRTPFLSQMYGKEITALFAEVKKAFDPKGIFNPKKKVGATWQYSLQYLMTHN